jgi:hypothetical protein
VGDIHDDLPFPDHSFDAVVCLNALHDFKRPGLLKASQETERHKQVHCDRKTRSRRRALLTRLGRQGRLRPPHFLAQG